ncbi:unnamed protein product [Euphydryas editha]|uniref:Reverse transcriptase domain-containing protein n=1 Tax=Euphydryas editha TaxID=104508 RepID=A0AAU9UME8_EUPED|nr:unnamed protein product [Euphydryas editha]
MCAQDAGEITILVLLDFSHAFDTINRPLFLSKLNYYGFISDAVKWFASYLESIKQLVEMFIKMAPMSVQTCSVDRGVPQGAILGPIIFALYCADIVNNIKHCKYHIYADDVQIYMSFRKTEASIAIQNLNDDLNHIAEWSDSYALS